MKDRAMRLWPRIIQAALALGLFALLAWRLDLEGLGEALGQIDVAVALAAVAINIPIVLLFALRSHLVLRRMGYRTAPGVVIAVATVGNVAGSLTPASSGEVLRAVALRTHTDASTSDALALVLFERGLSVYLLTLGTLAALAAVALPIPAAVAVCALLGLALFIPWLCSPLLRHVPHTERHTMLGAPLPRPRGVADRLRALLSSPSLAFPWMAVTAGVFVLLTLQFWLLARATEDVVSPRQVWIAIGASQLAAIVSLIPLGLGASDASLAAILNRFSMALENATAVAVLVRATSTLPMVLLAAVSYVYLLRRTPPSDPPAQHGDNSGPA
jgi:uncharacterized membrane protein YbhN (UPF0104 family)